MYVVYASFFSIFDIHKRQKYLNERDYNSVNLFDQKLM